MPGPIRRIIDLMGEVRLWSRSMSDVKFFLHRVLWDAGFPWTRLEPTPLAHIFPGIERATESLEVVHPFERTRGTSMELEELMVVLAIARFRGARRAVEVGTFDGNTALNLAINLGPEGRVVTIDLPPDGDPRAGNAAAGSIYAGGRPTPFARRQYAKHPAASRIRQVYGDSAGLDWTALGGPFDFAFIDGDHSAAYVEGDTRSALSVLAPGGTVLWHDYDWREVAAVIDGAVARGAPITWIRSTRLAVATIADPAAVADAFRSPRVAGGDAAARPGRG
jgi:predicted O-methyltransferase YrrM